MRKFFQYIEIIWIVNRKSNADFNTKFTKIYLLNLIANTRQQFFYCSIAIWYKISRCCNVAHVVPMLSYPFCPPVSSYLHVLLFAQPTCLKKKNVNPDHFWKSSTTPGLMLIHVFEYVKTWLYIGGLKISRVPKLEERCLRQLETHPWPHPVPARSRSQRTYSPRHSFVFSVSTESCSLFVRQIRRTTCPVYLIRRTTTRTRSHLSRSACRTTRAWNRATRRRTAVDEGSSAR